MKRSVFVVLSLVLFSYFLIGCAGEVTQLYMKDSTGATKTIEYPKGTITGAASKEQARTLAQIFVDSHNMAMSEFAEIKGKTSDIKQSTQRIEAEIQKLDATTQEILRTSKTSLETAQKALEMIEQMSQRQGTGEITIFYPVGSSEIPKGSIEYQRLINFVDYLSRESKGRKVLFISIGSASAFGDRRFNERLAQKRAEAPIDIIEKYLVNIPHEFFKVYGTGDIYSPKNVTMKEHQRYQHTRLIAIYETEQIPQLPAQPSN